MVKIKKTQKNIRIVLTTRFYAWEDARNAAMEDPEVDLYADPQQGEQAYLPGQQDEQVRLRPAWMVEAKARRLLTINDQITERTKASTNGQIAYIPNTPASQSQVRI
nr:54s ribosomal protein l4, mitochondrial [Quercus suber]